MNKKLLLIATLLCFNFAILLDAVSTPVIGRSYNDRFAHEISPSRAAATVGSLDSIFGTSGSLSLSSIGTQSKAYAVQALADGTFVVLLSDASNSYLAKFTETGVLEPTYSGGTGFGTNGVCTLTGLKAAASSIVVDAQSRFVVCGTDNVADLDHPWIRRVTAAGSVDSTFTFTPAESAGWVNELYGVAQQTSGKIIALGQNSSTRAQVARYNLDGSLDTAFGTAGYIVFDGAGSPVRPISQYFIIDLVVASDDSMFVAYLNGPDNHGYVAKFNANGSLATGFGVNGIVADALGSTVMTHTDISCVLNSDGNIVVIGQIGNDIKVNCFNFTTGAAVPVTSTSFASMTIHDAADVLYVGYPIATSDGNIIIAGYNTTDIVMRVDSVTNAGVLDTKFNSTGANEFFIAAVGLTASKIKSISVAPDGKLLVAGYQIASGVTTPFVSRLNNNPYVSSVAQYPVEQAQGDFDKTFGGLDVDTGDGIARPFDGRFGALLQQSTNAVIELVTTPGKILVGLDGYLDSDNHANMMLANLNVDGSLNTAFNGSGKIALPLTYTNEYMASLLEDKDGNLLVAGYDASSHAFIRKYPTAGSTGVATWEAVSTGGAAIQYNGVAIQSTQRILAFGQIDASHGFIAAYLPNGSLDSSTFNSAGSIPGKISGADFAGTPLLNMGAIYACVVNDQDNIYVAYKNNSTNKVDVALIYRDGRGLITEFNPLGTTPGIVNDVFGVTITNPQDVRIALDNEGDLVVAAAIGANYKLKRLFAVEAFIDSAYDTNFGTAGTLTIAAGTAVSINQLTTLNDNTIIITGKDHAADETMLVIRVTQAGALDATFNSQGVTAGILPLKIGHVVTNYNARNATGLVVQAASGNMIVVGYEKQTASLTVPMVMRVYGKSGTTQVKQCPIDRPEIAGTLDTTFDFDFDSDSDGSLDLSLIDASLTGATKSVYAYRSGSAKQGYYLVAVDTGYHTKIARIRQNDNSLDLSFGGGTGIVTLTGILGLNHMSIDATNKILVAGTQSGLGWAKRITSAGVVDVSFASLSHLVEINGLYQQKSGRYILAGKDDSGRGVLVAFQDKLVSPAATLAVDITFSPLGATAGWFIVSPASGLYNVTINNDDTILVAYLDTTVKLQSITANGSGLNQLFNSGSIKDTTITPSDSTSIRAAIDINGKIIVAAAVAGNTISTVRYSASGVIDAGFNGGAVYAITANKLGTANVKLTNLIITNEPAPATDGKIILMGYNTAGGNGRLFTARLGTNGTLDSTTWNTSPSGSDVAGLTTFSVASGISFAVAMYESSIFINGDIYGAVAAQGTSDKALLVRIFADNYVTQVEEQPLEMLPGIIDATLDILTPGSGAYNLDTAYPALSLNGYTAKTLKFYASGASLLGLSNGAATKIVKFKADGYLDTTGAFAGVNGYLIVPIANLRDAFIVDGNNDDSSIFLTGDNGAGVMVVAKVNSAGVIQTFVAPNTTPAMTFGSAIIQSTNSRVIVAGYDGTNGVIVAYKNDGSAIDLSFSNGAGKLLVGTTGLYDLALDTDNRMYVAYKNGSVINVQRIEANGSQVDPLFIATAISQTTLLSATQIRVAVDSTNNHLVVAVQDGTGAGNVIKVYRYNFLDGSTAGSLATQVSIPGKTLNLSDLFIDNAKNIYVAGYNSTDHYGIVAKIKHTGASTIALDTAYAAAGLVAGIANVNTGVVSYVVGAAALHPDRRVYLFGDRPGVQPTLSRIFGDVYTLEDDRAIFKAVEGTPDLTLDPNDVTQDGGVVLSNITGWGSLSGYIARGVHANADGTSFVVLNNVTDMVVGKLDCDLNPMTAFGDSGLLNGVTNPLTMPILNSMAVDSVGRILALGMNGGAQKILRFSADGLTHSMFSGSTITLTSANRIVEQKSGRVLVAGGQAYSAGLGGATIIAYKHTGTGLDTTYGPQGSDGFIQFNINTPIDDMVVDQYDDAYIVYRDTTVKLQKITENGSGRDAIFASGAIVDTGIVATQPARIGINNAGNILVAASSGTSIKTALYNWTTGALIGSVQDLSASNSNSPVVTGITGAADKFVMSAYETTNGGAQKMLAIRMTSAGIPDATFNPGGSEIGISYNNPETATQMLGITVQPDGRIIMVGKNASRPELMRVYATPYKFEDAQYPDQALAGTLDLTLFPSLGDMNLEDLLETVGLDNYTARRAFEDGAGKMLIAFDNGTDTILVRLYKDLTLDTTFNAAGAGGMVAGSLKIASKTTVRGLAVDSHGAIYVSGGVATAWLRAFNNNGTALTGFTTPTSTPSVGGYEIALQTLDRIILAGQNDDIVGGVLYGYKSTTGELDPEFGNGTTGIYHTGVAGQPITDVAIDSLDRIYIVYNDGANNSVIQRINTNGSLVDTNFGTPTGFNNVTGNELRVVVDNANSHVIIAAAITTGFKVKSYSTVNGATVNGPITIAAGGSSTSHLANMYVTSDNKIVIVGYETTGNNIVAVRLNADLTHDTSFNPNGSTPGELITTVGLMTRAYDATIHTDDRMMIFGGDTGATLPYMCRVFGDDYVTVDTQEPSLGVPGTLDPTFNIGSTFINLNTFGAGILNNSSATAVLPLLNGKQYVTLDNGSYASNLVRLTESATSAPVLDTAWSLNNPFNGSTHGYILDTHALGDHGTAVKVDVAGNVVVTGYIASSDQTYIARYTPAGDLDTNNFNPSSPNPGYIIAGGNAHGDQGQKIAIQSDNKIIVASYNDGGVAINVTRYNANGTVDSAYGTTGVVVVPGTNALHNGPSNYPSFAVGLQSDGKLIVVGTQDSSTNILIFRYTISGVLDLTFGSGTGYITDTTGQANVGAVAVAIQVDNKIVITANTPSSNNIYIARYLADGSGLDTVGFNAGGTPGYILDGVGSGDHGTSVAIDSIGNIIVTGNIDGISANQTYIARYTSLGVLDTAGFNTGGTPGYIIDASNGHGDQGQAVVIQSDNKILVASYNNGDGYVNIARYTTAGLLDGTFGTAGVLVDQNVGAIPHASIALQVDDKLIVTGSGDSNHIYIARYTAAGVLDSSTFNLGGYIIESHGNGSHRPSVITQPDGKVLAGGYDPSSGKIYIVRFTTAGLLDTASFGASDGHGAYLGYVVDAVGNGDASSSLATQHDGKIIVAGYYPGTVNLYVARYTTAGVLDTTFGQGLGYVIDAVGFGNTITGMVLQSDEKILITGYSTPSNRIYLARYTKDGVLDTTFAGGAGYVVDEIVAGNDRSSIALQPDGKIIVVGNDLSIGHIYMSRYTTAGVLDTTFGPWGSGHLLDTNGYTNGGAGVAIQSDGKIVISALDGTSGNFIYLARYLANGSGLDTATFGSGLGYIIDNNGRAAAGSGVTLQSDGKILVSAYEPSASNIYVARYLNDGSALDTSFGSGLGYVIEQHGNGNGGSGITVAQDQKIVAAGCQPSTTNMYVVRFTRDGVIDTATTGTGIAPEAPEGAFAIFADALGNLVVSGTDNDGYGWIKRYTPDGFADSSFNYNSLVSGLSGKATAALEQSMARVVVAGKGSTNGVVRAFQPNGAVDTLFGPTLNGEFDTGVATGVYTVVADVYDRLIIAYKNGSNIDLARLTSNGELDITFGDVSGVHNTGVHTGALSGVGADESSVRVALDDNGHIIVVGLNSGATGVKIAAFDNNSSANNNGAPIGAYSAGTPVTGLTGAVITSFLAAEDEKMLIGGYESGSNQMWVARINASGSLDTTFNPASGIKMFSFDGAGTVRHNNAMALFEDGRIAVVGYETNGVKHPFATRVYCDPYQAQVAEWLDAQAIGTNDLTFGLTGNNLFTFYATPAGVPARRQKPEAIGVENSNRFIIALDGRDDSGSTASQIFINKFNMDGILDTNFNLTGQATLTPNYDNEYVRSMVVFTTPEGVNKAILAGFASSTTLGLNNSLLVSYNLDTAAYDSTFGGFDQDPIGQAFADIASHQVVGMQSSSRIITGGLNYDNTGMILGYTQLGKLDKTFAADGYYFTASTDGIFSHAIDTLDRVVFAYIDGSGNVLLARLLADGSALDPSFNSGAGFLTTDIGPGGAGAIASSADIRVAVDYDGNIVVAAMSGDQLSLTVERFHNDGTYHGYVDTYSDIVYGFTQGTMTKLIVDQDNKIIVVGSDVVAGIANMYLFRIDSDMSGFDSTFNGVGYILYHDTQMQNPTDAIMHPDGRVVAIAYENNPPA